MSDVRQGLETIRDMLRAGKLPHISHYNERQPEGEEGPWFNMTCWVRGLGCGTVYCMGGYLEKLLARDINKDMDEDEGLEGLFHPSIGNWNNISCEEAAQAIDNYLETGEAQWETVKP